MSTTQEIKLPKSRKIALTNVRVFDGYRICETSTVVIDGTIIGEDVEGAEIVDGGGGILLPGLIDAHVHLGGVETLRQMAGYGVTTALDMASWPATKLSALRGHVGLTDFRSAGLPASCPGSIHSHILPLPAEALLSGPEDVPRFINDRISEGADYIKVVSDVPGPDQATLDALVVAAHEHNKFVVAHAASFVPFRMAQDAKADVITHVPLDKTLDDEDVRLMVDDHRIAVPTLTMMENFTRPPSLFMVLGVLMRPSLLLAIIRNRRQNPYRGSRDYAHAKNSVTAMHRAGVPILAETDVNPEGGALSSMKYGDSLHHELELLVDAGLSTVDALRAATSLPAKYFELEDRGVIEVGKRADLVLISEDPIRDIRATRSIQKVWCAGIEVKRL